MTDVQTTLSYEDGLFSVEEENLLGNGAIVEVDQELMLVTNANTSTRVLSVSRGYQGTDPESRNDKTNIFSTPNFPRKSVFDAVAATLVEL